MDTDTEIDTDTDTDWHGHGKWHWHRRRHQLALGKNTNCVTQCCLGSGLRQMGFADWHHNKDRKTYKGQIKKLLHLRKASVARSRQVVLSLLTSFFICKNVFVSSSFQDFPIQDDLLLAQLPRQAHRCLCLCGPGRLQTADPGALWLVQAEPVQQTVGQGRHYGTQ